MTLRRIAAVAVVLASASFAQDAPPQTAAPVGASDTNERLYLSFQMGVLAIQHREWDDAVAELSEATQLDPTRGAAWARLGEAYYGMARSKRGAESNAALGKSVDAYAKAVEKTPDDAAYHNGYALSLAASGRLDEMQPEMEKAATLDPTKAAQYYYTFGGILLSSGRADAAASAFGKAAKAAPGVPEIYFQYGSALASQARITEEGKAALPAAAIDAFHSYLQTAPNGPFAAVVKEALAFDGAHVETAFGEPVSDKPGAPRATSVGGGVQEAKLAAKQQPAYPALARRLRIAGTVSLNALIGEDGAVIGLAVDSGNPFLAGAAIDAVKRWNYKPTLLNDKPVRIRTRIDVAFSPGGSSGRPGQ
jgi:TonB family protein